MTAPHPPPDGDAATADPPAKKQQSAFERARRRMRPYLAAAVVLGLVVVQARALGQQHEYGFRPFLHEPGRALFSWDMFAQQITRCDIEWSPPLKPKSASNERFARMRSLSPYIEWNPAIRDASSYLAFGRRACARYGDGPERSFTLTCFYPGFRETQSVIPCH